MAQQDDCSEVEQGMIRDLEVTQKYMQWTIYKSKDKRLTSASYLVQANLLAGGILRQMDVFTQTIKELYDTTREKNCN